MAGYCLEVKTAWILPSSFLVCLWTETDRVEVHKLPKKERGQYPAILTKLSLVNKGLLNGCRGNFSCGTQQVVLRRQDSSILPAQLANHSAGFDSSCPLTELAI